MPRVKITVTESRCRCGIHRAGEEYIVDSTCPPICHELWSCIYPGVYALLNGADLDFGEIRAPMLQARCPDGGRVVVHCEVIRE